MCFIKAALGGGILSIDPNWQKISLLYSLDGRILDVRIYKITAMC